MLLKPAKVAREGSKKREFRSPLPTFCTDATGCTEFAEEPTLWTLIAARTLQGFGGGIALPLGTAMLYAAFPPEERGNALGTFGIALVVALALGPILGGWLVDLGHWRWIFFINIPIGIVGVTLGSLWLREQRRGNETRFDPLGLLFSTVGFGAVLYAASIAADKGWSSPNVVVGFIVGVVALIIFALVELFVAAEPLLDLRLFAKPIFTLAAITGYVSTVALFGAEFLMPLYLQVLRGRTALQAGLLLLPLAIASAFVSPFAGRLYDKFGPRPLATLGFGLLAINTWQLSQLTTTTSIAWIQFLLALRGIALGLTVQTTLTTALSVVPGRQTARGSALINATRQVIQSIGVAILATVLATAVAPGVSAQLQQFQAAAPKTQEGATPIELCTLQPAAAGAAPTSNTVPAQAYPTIQSFCGQYVTGLRNAYHLTFFAALLATLLGATLPGWPFTWTGRASLTPRGPAESTADVTSVGPAH